MTMIIKNKLIFEACDKRICNMLYEKEWRKRHAKLLHKQTYEEQMLTEFIRDSLIKLCQYWAKKKQKFSTIDINSKINTNSFSYMQNIYVIQERFEMNSDINQWEIKEHQIENYNYFMIHLQLRSLEDFNFLTLRKNC